MEIIKTARVFAGFFNGCANFVTPEIFGHDSAKINDRYTLYAEYSKGYYIRKVIYGVTILIGRIRIIKNSAYSTGGLDSYEDCKKVWEMAIKDASSDPWGAWVSGSDETVLPGL